MRHFALDSLRLISAYAVIALHVCAVYVTTASVGSVHWWAGNLLDSALRWCVPFFVMITGALLLEKPATPLAQFYRKRASILLPFAFWIAAYLLYHALGQWLLGGQYDTAAAIALLLSQPPHYHLWYLYMIVPLLMLVPALRSMASSKRALMLMLCVPAAVWFAQLLELIPRTPLLLRWLEFMGYLLAGHVLFSQRFALPQRWLGLACVAAISVIAALTYQFCSSNECTYSPYYDYHSPLVMLLSLCLFALWLQRLRERGEPAANKARWVSRLTPLALGIYLIHPIFIDMAFYIAPPSFPPLAMLPVMIVLVSLLSAASAALLHRIPYLRRVIALR